MSVLFLIIIIILVSVFVVTSLLTKSFIDKKNAFYFIPLLLINFFLYYVGYTYKGNTIDGITFFEMLAASLKCFSFEIKREYVAALMNDNFLFAIDVYTSVILSGLTLFSTLIGFFKISIFNFLRSFFSLKFSKPDIVVGYSENAIKYCRANKNTILCIDTSDKVLTTDFRKTLYLEKIKFLTIKTSVKTLEKIVNRIQKTRKTHIIFFDLYLKSINDVLGIIEEFNAPNGHIVEFHIQSNDGNVLYLNEELTARLRKITADGKIIRKENIMASAFDDYELMTRYFSYQHNLAKYLPEGFIKNGELDSDININVVFIGFGKVAKAIFKGLILNNQFVQYTNEGYKVKPVNYYLYDKNEKSFDDHFVSQIMNLDEFFQDGEGYLPKIENPANIYLRTGNVKSETPFKGFDQINSDKFLKSIYESFNKKNDYTYFIISIGNTIDNLVIANTFAKRISEDRCTIFYNIDSKKEEVSSFKAKNLIPFGYRENYLSHDIIAIDDLCRLATANNDIYFKLKGQKPVDFYSLPLFEKLSNIYADINLSFKLNLLGLSYSKDASKPITKEEFMELYYPEFLKTNTLEYSLEKYKERSTRTALMVQEHIRWCVFYYLNGYSQMNLNDISIYEGKCVHKDTLFKYHACLTNIDGLYELAHKEIEVYKKANIEKTFEDVETFKYDMQLLDNIYEGLKEAGYYINRK